MASALYSLLAAGCATTPSDVSDMSDVPAVVAEPTPNVAVILSEAAVNQRELCYVLANQMTTPYRIFDLSQASPLELRNAISRYMPQRVIAVGAPGLEVAREIPDVDIVYAGVAANPAGHRRVDALPPFAVQLAYWRKHSPTLGTLGVVASPEMGHLVERLATAAANQGIQLISQQAGTDKQALAHFRAMVPKIDGFVFLPDQRILSPSIINAVIAHGQQNAIEIAVYSPAMYAAGATHLFLPDTVDVATQVVSLLNSDKSNRALTKMMAESRADTVLAARD